MLTVKAIRRRNGRPADSVYRCDLDLPGVRQPQRQLIAVYPQLHGVAHGCEFHQRHLRAGDQSHIQKMLAQGALSAHCRDPGRLADLQLVQHHFSLLLYFHICILPLWICPLSQCKCTVIWQYRQDDLTGKRAEDRFLPPASFCIYFCVSHASSARQPSSISRHAVSKSPVYQGSATSPGWVVPSSIRCIFLSGSPPQMRRMFRRLA